MPQFEILLPSVGQPLPELLAGQIDVLAFYDNAGYITDASVHFWSTEEPMGTPVVTVGRWTLAAINGNPYTLSFERDDISIEAIQAEQPNLAAFVGDELAAVITDSMVRQAQNHDPQSDYEDTVERVCLALTYYCQLITKLAGPELLISQMEGVEWDSATRTIICSFAARHVLIDLLTRAGFVSVGFDRYRNWIGQEFLVDLTDS